MGFLRNLGSEIGLPPIGDVVRGISGQTGAEAQLTAAQMQQQGLRESREAQERAFREVAPGLAQFLGPGRAAAFGFNAAPGGAVAPATAGLSTGQAFGGPGVIPGPTAIGGPGQAANLQFDPINQLRAAAGGLGPAAQSQFFQNFQEDPGTQFLRQQGQRGIEQSLSAAGGLGGGQRLKAVSEFNQGLANQQLGQRLSQLGQLGQTDIGLASSLANLRTGLGSAQGQAAQAAGQAAAQGGIGAANAQAQGAQNIAGIAATIASLFSDERLKENVKPMDNALDKVMSLSGYEWDWKTPIDQQSAGVMAQEIEQVLVDAVVEMNGIKLVNYPMVVGLCVEAIKELKESIDG